VSRREASCADVDEAGERPRFTEAADTVDMRRLLITTVVAAVASCAPAAAAASDGSYKGTTNADRNAFATVKKGKVSFSMALNTRCRSYDGTYRFATDIIEFRGARLKGKAFT
jgi:hypothetical protein